MSPWGETGVLVRGAFLCASLLACPASAASQLRCYGLAEGELAVPGPGGAVRASPDQIRSRAAELIDLAASADVDRRALTHCVVAELLKQVGDTRAVESYRAAMELDPANPEYPWLFGDYFRNYRGPGQPLFAEAERAYHQALGLIAPAERACARVELVCFVQRSLIALYEADGLALGRPIGRGPPLLHLSSSVVVGRRTSNPEEVDDVRDFTSEALFAASRVRLDGALDRSQELAILRSKEQAVLTTRLRLRPGSWPVLDLFVERRTVNRAHVGDFLDPSSHQDATVEVAGLALEKPFAAYPVFDFVVRAQARRLTRRGLIERAPEAREDVNSFVASAAASRFIGPDKVTLGVSAAREDIDPKVEPPFDRRMTLLASRVSYQRFRGGALQRRIARRGSEVFAGVALATERFDSVDVHTRDIFTGVALRGIPGLSRSQSFDVTVQPTWLAGRRVGTEDGLPAERLGNRQVRTFATVLYRLLDRENVPDVRALRGLVFLNAVLLGSVDAAVEGPSTYASRTIGAGLEAKIVALSVRGGTTVLASARVDVQDYPHLDRTLSGFEASLRVGF